MPPLIIYPNGAKISGRDKSLPYKAAKSRGGIHASPNRLSGRRDFLGRDKSLPYRAAQKKSGEAFLPPLQRVGVSGVHRSSRK